jgi:glucosamine--fructose-6-phosphate aminotransferase (isomerizing)
MCGIFASISSNETSSTTLHTVLSGLQALQYRGYDSAGVGWLSTDGFRVEKVLGDADALRKALGDDIPKTRAAIGHTRWATHGKPSVKNAHPVRSDRFILVHNGVLDQHHTYRDLCLSEGYTFASDTDSEVLVMMIERASRSQSGPIESWLPALLDSFEGHWSIVWMDQRDRDHVYAYHRGCPVVVSHNNISQGWISSDVMSLAACTDVCTVLEANTLVKVSAEGARVWQQGMWQDLAYEKHGLASESKDLGGFPHFMLKEIHEQQTLLKKQYTHYEESSEGLDTPIDSILKAIETCRDIMIVACGSSYYAACVARYAMEKYLHKRVSVDIASEFNERSPALFPDTLLIVISQSGETADTLSALEYAKEQGVIVIALCNVPSSAIGTSADHLLPLYAGLELGVASTKAFCAQVFALLYLTRRLAVGVVSESDVDALVRLLQGQWSLLPGIKKLASELISFQHLIFIARDHLVPIAFEGALKYKEITYIHAEAYPAGELKHGPLALIDEDHPTIALIEPQNRNRMMANIEEIRARGGKVYVFEMGDQTQTDATLSWPNEVKEWLQPLAFLLPLQLLAYESCVLLGHNVDRPRNLAKCVTVE